MATRFHIGMGPTIDRQDEPATGMGDRSIAPILCFLAGLTVLLPVAPLARVTLFDLVAAGLLVGYWSSVSTMLRGTVALLTVSIAAMLFSAYVNGSGMAAFVGRAYSPVLLMLEIAGYAILIRNTSDTGRMALVVGAMLGICCHFFYPNEERVLTNPIKFLIGIPLGVGVVAAYALAWHNRKPSVGFVVLLMISYAVMCFLVGSRSVGGVYFVSALLLSVIGRVRMPANYASFAPMMIVIAGLLGYGFTELYTFLAIKGFFGNQAAGIAVFQSSFGSILLGGRPEIIVNFSGIRDAPLLGVGIGNYPSVYLYEMLSLSVYSSDDVFDIQNILYHSSLFATAFESGIIAALFWAFLLYRAVFVIPLMSILPVGIRALVLPLTLISVWNILYSPPIPYNRFIMGISLAFIFHLYSHWKQERTNDARLATSPPSD